MQLTKICAVFCIKFGLVEAPVQDRSWIQDKLYDSGGLKIVLIGYVPLLLIGETNSDGTVEECLDARSLCSILIWLEYVEIP